MGRRFVHGCEADTLCVHFDELFALFDQQDRFPFGHFKADTVRP